MPNIIFGPNLRGLVPLRPLMMLFDTFTITDVHLSLSLSPPPSLPSHLSYFCPACVEVLYDCKQHVKKCA